MPEQNDKLSVQSNDSSRLPEPTIKVIAPPDIRNSVAVPLPGETDEERQRRDDIFHAVLEISLFSEEFEKRLFALADQGIADSIAELREKGIPVYDAEGPT